MLTAAVFGVGVELGLVSLSSGYNAGNIRMNAEDGSRAVFGAPIVTGVYMAGLSGTWHFMPLGFGTLGGGLRVAYGSATVAETTWTRADGSWQRTIGSALSSLWIEAEAVWRLDGLQERSLFPYAAVTFGIQRNGLSFNMADLDLNDPGLDTFRYHVEAAATVPVVGLGVGVEWTPVSPFFAGVALHLRAGPDVSYSVTASTFTRSTGTKGNECSGPHVACAVVPISGNTIPSYDPGGAVLATYSGAELSLRLGARF